ncbi:MAG: thiamine phosphate synthase [Pyrinomonadaceae bacterium]
MASSFSLPKIYPITDRDISGISHLEQIRLFVDGGARFIQIRDKNATSLELFREFEECAEFAKAYGAKLIVNDRIDIAFTSKADGVHLGQNDLPPDKSREILGNNAIIGYSTHIIEQAIAAAKLPIDYIAIGPIFATKTKVDHEMTVGLAGIESVRKVIGSLPLVAIGGIGLENISDVLNAGADSVALVSALVSNPKEIADRTRRAFEIAERR